MHIETTTKTRWRTKVKTTFNADLVVLVLVLLLDVVHLVHVDLLVLVLGYRHPGSICRQRQCITYSVDLFSVYRYVLTLLIRNHQHLYQGSSSINGVNLSNSSCYRKLRVIFNCKNMFCKSKITSLCCIYCSFRVNY